jgi:hypothetical protein
MGLTMFLTVKPPADVPEGTLRARLYNMSSPSQTCAAMRARVTNLAANRVNGVVISQFDTAVPCGDVNRMQLSLEDTQGRVIVATGNQEPDLPVSLRLVP